MIMEFNNGNQLRKTDYWMHADGYNQGLPWVAVRDGVWHLLPPQAPNLWKGEVAIAVPLRKRDEPAGWYWGIYLAKATYYVPLSCFHGGHVPSLPPPGTRLDRRLVIYGQDHGRVTYGFGIFDSGVVPVHASLELSIVRPRRKSGGGWDWKPQG